MSDLAPFVAATIRDSVVKDQQDEIQRLKRDNAALQSKLARIRTVAVTGPNGVPVYAQGELDTDGEQLDVDSVPRWLVELTPNPEATCTTVQQLLEIEVRIGDTGKKMATGGPHEYGYFLDYDENSRLVDITLIGDPILHGTLGPISQETLRNLRNNDEFDLRDESAQVLGGVLPSVDDGEPVAVLFESVKFNNDLHTMWNVEFGQPDEN